MSLFLINIFIISVVLSQSGPELVFPFEAMCHSVVSFDVSIVYPALYTAWYTLLLYIPRTEYMCDLIFSVVLLNFHTEFRSKTSAVVSAIVCSFCIHMLSLLWFAIYLWNFFSTGLWFWVDIVHAAADNVSWAPPSCVITSCVTAPRSLARVDNCETLLPFHVRWMDDQDFCSCIFPRWCRTSRTRFRCCSSKPIGTLTSNICSSFFDSDWLIDSGYFVTLSHRV